MKTLNSEKESKISVRHFDEVDKYPCWYANIKRSEKRNDCKWEVGCNYDGKSDEYSFKISKIGDIKNDKFWNYVTSEDFAVKLIDLYKNGGQKNIKNWVKRQVSLRNEEK
jgi:hypothetical protein